MKTVTQEKMQHQLQDMCSTFEVMKQFMVNSGFMPNQGNPGDEKARKQQGKDGKPNMTIGSPSETTIYCNVLNKIDGREVIVDPEITFQIETKDNSNKD